MKVRMKLGMLFVVILPLLHGCGEKEVLAPEPSVSMSETFKYEPNDEAVEGYVYDYQVSMEPIPVEIAALGGEVCGTIHAYPTEIEVGLAKKAIEENPEWQKMNEENIEFLKKYLTEQYGGEFDVEAMTADFSTDEYMMNRYRCTEGSTGNKFSITLYKNPYLELNEGKIGRNDYFL